MSVNDLWVDVAKCKSAKTCARLSTRTYWFEPNPGTIASWQREGRFTPGIDRRVVFVCESPTKHASGRPDFVVPGVGIDGWRCWGGYNARVTDGFWKARERYGLQHCWITNVVKCGTARGGGPPVRSEAQACAPFLARELEMLQPGVIVLVGKTETPKLYANAIEKAAPAFEVAPRVMLMTHYSYERRPLGRGRMPEIWAPEFQAILDELAARGLREPVWHTL